jgi:signal transduction histidine kinase
MYARLRQLLRTSAMRLALRYAIVQTLLLAAALVVLLIFADRYVAAQLEAGLASEASALAALPTATLAQRLDALAATHGPRHYLLLDAQGRRLAGDLVGWPDGLTADGRAARVSARVAEHDEPGHSERLDLVARGSVLPGGARLVVAQEPGASEDLREAVFAAAGIVLALAAALSLGFGFALGSRWLARIDAINRTAGAIAGGDLTQRVDTHGQNDEFDLLAGHLNHMLTRIEAAVAGMRAVSDHVAHDLRRPLARLKTRIDVLLEHPRSADEYRAALQQTVADADELMRTFDALLSIARLEAGSEIVAPQAFDLAALARDVAELYAAEAEDAGRPFHIELAVAAQVAGDARLVAQALANLLDNAFKYTAPDVPVEVRLTRYGDRVRLAVVDHGAGLSDTDKTRLVARFARGDAARSQPGSGLGLALAAAVAHAHGGELELADTPGGGLDAGLVLPCASMNAPQ